MSSPKYSETPRIVRPKANKGKSWIRELLVGVSGTVLGALVLTAMGLNSDGPAPTDQGRLPTAQLRGPVEAGSPNLSTLVAAVSATQPPSEPPVAGFDPAISVVIPGEQAPALMGKWEQWVYHPVHKKWYSGGIYRVTIRQQKLAMSILDNTDVDTDMVNSQGITGVSYIDGLWNFNSQLESNELLHFQLRCVDKDTFCGYCYQNGEALSANTWHRVK
jgi:hypothetical protein